MAARWRRTRPSRNAGNNVSVATDAFKAGNLPVDAAAADMQSCVDQTIFAIFEDSALMSEAGNGVDDEKLLSALSEMLDAVEEDGSLSPFHSLPSTELLAYPKSSASAERPSLGGRPGPTSVKTKTDEGKKESKKKEGSPPHLLEPQALLCSNTWRAEAGVEVFSSSSLINLVKIMHPYCLKLQVEEEGERLSRRQAFSQEQVWKYQTPQDGSDEEINVVSDDDEGPKEKMFLRSVLWKEESSGQRKRVSFGAVHVSSFEESLRVGLIEKTQENVGEAPSNGAEAVTGSLLDQNVSQDVAGRNAGVVPLKKARSLSLQQYRLRQQARAPLVEQPGNYTAQWPSVCGTPQELTRGTGPALLPPVSQPSACQDPSRTRRSRAECPTSPPHRPARHSKVAAKSQRSLQRKPPVSSDPPNPVVLPVGQATPPSGLDEARSLGTCVQLQLELAPPADPRHTCEQTPSPELLLPSSQSKEEPPTEADRKWRPAEASAGPGSGPVPHSRSAASGIEAADLSSLLEQFEETQAKEERAQPSKEVLEAVAAAESAGTQDTLRTCRVHTSLAGPVPKPLEGDVIVDMQIELLSNRPKNPSAKGVQIIDPRPLPNRKRHRRLSAVSAVLVCHVSSDHDYCRADVWTQPGHPCPGRQDTAPTWYLSSRVRDSPKTPGPGRPGTGSHTPSAKSPSGSEERTGPWPPPTPPARPPPRAGTGRRCGRRGHCGASSCSSSSSSRSPSPKRHPGKRSGSRSSSGSPPSSHRRCVWARSRRRGRSRSTSWSRPRGCSSRTCRRLRSQHESRVQRLKAMDERRVVYVGRICGSMTHDELKERFLQFGQVECVSLHFRETGDHYGFVTFRDVKDAFAAIDSGSKLRRPDEKPFDLCFGGRRQFCPSDYTDLDREIEPSARNDLDHPDFDQLLRQAQGACERPS